MLVHKKNYKIYSSFLKLSIIVLFSLFISNCKINNEIKIGFAGSLTGRYSDLGLSARNGVILAVEQLNKRGGIRGRHIKLIIKDDRNDPATAIKVDKELIDEGVVAILGHATSAITTSVIPLINKHKILLLSGTTSTSKLAGIDDYFLRVISASTYETKLLAAYIHNKLKLKRMACAYDSSNRAYAEEYAINFENIFRSFNKKVLPIIGFSPNRNTSYMKIAKKLVKHKPEGILLIFNDRDVAMLSQQIKKLNPKTKIFACSWSLIEELLEKGGSSVEGIIIFKQYNINVNRLRYKKFTKQFIERFGTKPDWASTWFYDTARVLFKGLKRTNDFKNLKKAILKHKVFKVLQGKIIFDRYGDVKRNHFLITVKNGKFITLE